jgi:hypothetical protein
VNFSDAIGLVVFGLGVVLVLVLLVIYFIIR